MKRRNTKRFLMTVRLNVMEKYDPEKSYFLKKQLHIFLSFNIYICTVLNFMIEFYFVGGFNVYNCKINFQ